MGWQQPIGCINGNKSLINQFQMTIFSKLSIQFVIRLNRCIPYYLINKIRLMWAYFGAKKYVMRTPCVILKFWHGCNPNTSISTLPVNWYGYDPNTIFCPDFSIAQVLILPKF